MIRTTDERDMLLSEIDHLLPALFRPTNNRLQTVLADETRKETKDAFLAIWEQQNISLTDHQKLQVSLHELRDYLLSCPILALVLAISPTEKMLTDTCIWIRANVHPLILLAISIDRGIVGGVLMTFEGIYKDYSLRSRLDAIFTNQQTYLLSLLR